MSTPLSRRTLLRAGGAVGVGLTAAATALPTAASADPRHGGPGSSTGVTNLSHRFYNRPGLSGMPRKDWAGMPVANVRDFGAVGDGVADERPAFDAALAHLRTLGGGVIYVPGGRYLFAPPPRPGFAGWQPTQPLQNIHIIGAGESTIIQFVREGLAAGWTGAPALTRVKGWVFPDAVNVTVRDLSLTWTPHFLMRDSLGAYTLEMARGVDYQVIGVKVDQGQPAIWLPLSREAWVVDCEVYNSAADAIHFESGKDSVAAYNYIENATDDAVANYTNTSLTPDSSTVDNVRIVHNTALLSAWGRGMTLGGADEVMSDNWIESQANAGVYNDVGIFANAPVGDTYRAVIRRNVIIRANLAQREDNLYYRFGTGGYFAGIVFRDGVTGCTIEDNKIYGPTLHGINFGIEGWRDMTGTDITVRNNTIAGASGSGIRFIDGATVDRIDIAGNRISDVGAPSVEVNGTLTGVTTSGNRVSNDPVVNGSVTGDFTGFRRGGGSTYNDIYAFLRTRADETAWEEPPAVAASGHVVNVRSFGARGNGRSNDLPAFYRALAALPRRGGTIFVPAGRYRLEPSSRHECYQFTRIRQHLLIAERSNVHIRGVGDRSVLVFTSSEHQGLRLVGVSNCSVRKLRLELPARPALRRNRALLDLSGAQSCAVDEVTVVGSSGPGVLVDSSRRVRVTRVVSRNAGTYGIEAVASRQVLISDCDVTGSRDNGIQVNWMGSVAVEPQYVRVTGNRVSGSVEGGGIGVTAGHQVVAGDNEVTDTHLAGLYLYARSSHYPPRRVEFTGNTLTRVNTGRLAYTPGAVSVHSLSRGRANADLLVSGNSIVDTPYAGVWVGGPTPFGTKLSAMDKLEVTGNTFTGLGTVPLDITAPQRAQIAQLVTDIA